MQLLWVKVFCVDDEDDVDDADDGGNSSKNTPHLVRACCVESLNIQITNPTAYL